MHVRKIAHVAPQKTGNERQRMYDYQCLKRELIGGVSFLLLPYCII